MLSADVISESRVTCLYMRTSLSDRKCSDVKPRDTNTSMTNRSLLRWGGINVWGPVRDRLAGLALLCSIGTFNLTTNAHDAPCLKILPMSYDVQHRMPLLSGLRAWLP